MYGRAAVALLLCLTASAAGALVLDQRPTGYLGGRQPLDLARVPHPPAPGSSADRADRRGYAASLSGVDGPAWRAALTQLYPSQPAAMGPQIACILGRPVTAANAPTLFALLGKLTSDATIPVEAVKQRDKRPRPFDGVANPRACDPRISSQALSYSWPSGHAVIGVLWGRALAAIAPARAGSATGWGQAIGDNRIACRVHYASDVAAGQALGSQLYPLIAADPGFQRDLARARSEVDRVAGQATGCG